MAVEKTPDMIARTHYSDAPVNFSICFPCFNAVGIVRKMLASLTHLTTKGGFAFEVIMIDNNSTEDIRGAFDDYRDKLDLYLVERKKLKSTFSVASARNLANRLAKYEYIVCMDSDIVPPPEFLDNLYNFLKDKKEPYIVTAERIFVVTHDFPDKQILEEGPKVYQKFPKCRSRANYYLERDNRFDPGEIMINLSREGFEGKMVHPWAYYYGCNCIYPREIANKIGGYNENYDGYWGYDDIEFAYRMISEGKCKPWFQENTWVYHQEPAGENWVPIDKAPDVASNPRMNKAENPNWQRICKTIPGWAEWKTEYYKKLSKDITL